MADYTFPWPPGAVHCGRGAHIAHRDAGRWTVYRVDDFVRLDRLVPLNPDGSGFIEEQHLRDSVRPAYAGEVHVLLTGYTRELASLDEALRAVERGDLGPAIEGLSRKLSSFRDDDTHVIARAGP